MTSSSSDKAAKVGFVGLGNMGLPMCVNLLRKSADPSSVLAFDTNGASVSKAEMQGATPASSVEEIGSSGCDVIFTMLPGDRSVESVIGTILGAAGAATSSEKGCVFVDCSTVSPMVSRSLSEIVSSASPSNSMLDAPVSGGVRGAEDGTLTFMVGAASTTALEVARPLLDRMGKNVIHCGGSGTGSATKLCNNLALAAQMIGICEAMNLGDALGVDPVVLTDVMNMSTAKCWSSEVNNPHPDVATAKAEGGAAQTPAARDYSGGFGTKLMLKDLGLAVKSGQESGVALPLGTTSQTLYRMADLRGLGDKDFGVMLQFLRGK